MKAYRSIAAIIAVAILVLTASNLVVASESERPTRTEPVIYKEVLPEYPFELRLRGVEGEVVVAIIVDARGNVLAPMIMKSAHPKLDKAALDAVSQWKFIPASFNGRARASVVKVPISFHLVGDKSEQTSS